MRRILLVYMMLLTAVFVMAQQQQGYVKTKGRLGSNGAVIKGTRLSGATVTVKGRNAVISGNNGTFTLTIPGNSFYLQNVQKQGYVITDPDALSRQYAYSENPLVLVLEDKAQLEAEKRSIERKISNKLYAQLQEREEQIETLKIQNKITEEKYNELIQKLNHDQDDNESIIKDMAERYAIIDFDQIDEFNQRISDCIINGRLTEADSLLKTKGDIKVRTAELRQLQEQNAKDEKTLNKNKDLAQKKLEDIARDCYSKYEMFKMQHNNDSAAYYIEYRVTLDTTRVEWLQEAGDFVTNYKANYSMGLDYYRKALANAQKTSADKYVLLDCYNNLGIAYNYIGNNAEAMECYRQSLTLCDNDSSYLSSVYINIGNVFYDKSDFNKALSYYQQSLSIKEKTDEEEKEDIARLYTKIGNVYSDIGDFIQAKECFDKSYKLFEKTSGIKTSDIASCQLYMGYNYLELEQPNDAMMCFQRALDVFVEIYGGEQHPNVAVAYGGLASANGQEKDYEKQLEYAQKSLSIKKSIYGDKHQSIAIALNNLGMAYMKQKQYENSIGCFKQSLEICKIHYGEKHQGVAVIYRNLGSLYKELEQYDTALDYFQRSLKIALDLYGESNQVVQVSVNNLAFLYVKMKNYPMAIRYFKQSLSITEKVFVDNTSKLRSAVNNLYRAYQSELKQNPTDKELIKEFDAFKEQYSQYVDNIAK